MNSIFKVTFIEDVPKYVQIANHIKKLIESGKITDSQKLPTIREYTNFLEVNKITIVNTYKKLAEDGFAYQKVGSGTFAKKKETLSIFSREYSKTFRHITHAKLEKIIDFAGETTYEVIFPINEFKDIVNRVFDRDGTDALTSQDSLGFSKLRKTINKVFWKRKFEDDDILIVSGAQQGIDIASKVLLNVNDNVIVEKPTYGGALSVFKWRRANLFEVDMGKCGVNLEKFELILKKNKISCFYTMSYFQNPTGTSYSLEKKERLLELAEKYDFYIIEDDYLSELIYDKSIKYITFKELDKNQRVIYIKSFSKIFLPGIRIGYIIPPEKYKESMMNSKFNTDIATSSLMQRALEMYIDEGRWKENIAVLNSEYKKRYILMKDLIIKELSEFVECEFPGGGLSFYLKLKEKYITTSNLFYRLRKRNVLITPGILFYRKPSDGLYTFRIGFSQTNEEKIENGIKIIKEELEACLI